MLQNIRPFLLRVLPYRKLHASYVCQSRYQRCNHFGVYQASRVTNKKVFRNENPGFFFFFGRLLIIKDSLSMEESAGRLYY